MTYRLFIDDERFPPNDGHEWVIVRTYDEAIAYMEANGCPDYVSFDNDIQCEPLQGKDIAKWMKDKDLDEPGWMPAHFSFFAHSRNVSAAEVGIDGLLNDYLYSPKSPFYQRNH